jgi:glycosyltransferase involved in cell wall biosynthesis
VPRVLHLAYHFPPIGGGGVQRNCEFARNLPNYGYKTLVLTGSGRALGRWTPTDLTLLESLPESTEVYRTDEPRSLVRSTWRRRVDTLLMLPTAFSRDWTSSVLELGTEVGGNADLVYASLVPYEAAEAAGRLAAQLGKPWVADLQDPWALDEMSQYPTGLHRRIDLARMARLLRSTSAIVMNTPEAVMRVRRWLPELRDKVVVSIPNGFDPALFNGPAPTREDEGKTFRIVHTGYLHTELGLQVRRTARVRRLVGGMWLPIDILPRSHVYLVEALELLRAREPSLHSLIELHLAGVLSDTDRALVEGAEMVKIYGYLPHAESVSLARSADLLFLPMHKLPAGTRAGLVPGKTYEYLRSGRPILAAVPEGDARDLLVQAPSTELVAPDDVEGMVTAIERRIREWQRGVDRGGAESTLLEQFEQPRLAHRLARLFDEVLATEAGRPVPRNAVSDAR